MPKPSTLHQHIIWRIGILVSEVIKHTYMTETQKGRLKEQLENLLETEDVSAKDAQDFVVLMSGQAERLTTVSPQEYGREVADLLTQVIKKLKNCLDEPATNDAAHADWEGTLLPEGAEAINEKELLDSREITSS